MPRVSRVTSRLQGLAVPAPLGSIVESLPLPESDSGLTPTESLPRPEQEESPEERLQRLLPGPSPWPFLSEVEQQLSAISAGVHWPWKATAEPQLDGLATESLDGLDLAVVARVASASDATTARRLFNVLKKQKVGTSWTFRHFSTSLSY